MTRRLWCELELLC